jgi:hypothetical protein
MTSSLSSRRVAVVGGADGSTSSGRPERPRRSVATAEPQNPASNEGTSDETAAVES